MVGDETVHLYPYQITGQTQRKILHLYIRSLELLRGSVENVSENLRDRSNVHAGRKQQSQILLTRPSTDEEINYMN